MANHPWNKLENFWSVRGARCPVLKRIKRTLKVSFGFLHWAVLGIESNLHPLLISVSLSGIIATGCTTLAWHPSDGQGSIVYTRAGVRRVLALLECHGNEELIRRTCPKLVKQSAGNS